MCRLWIVAFLAVVASLSAHAAEPMAVRLVEGSPSCQPACGSWISAEGEIRADTPAQFRKVLSRLGGRKLPVIIHSPGGRLSAALAIGRMIRARGLSVAVGQTHFLQAGHQPVGEIIPSQGSCSSACPFILAAGVERYSGEGTLVGLHQALLIRHGSAQNRAAAAPQGSRQAADTASTARLFRSLRQKLRSYLSEMGVAPAVVDEMDKAPAVSMNHLAMARQQELGLITGEMTAAQLLGVAPVASPLADEDFTASMEPLP